jgi:hypothetical protein
MTRPARRTGLRKSLSQGVLADPATVPGREPAVGGVAQPGDVADREQSAKDGVPVALVALPGQYPRRTEHSITTYEELVTEIQRLGYTVDRQELNLGVWCVAAPILGVRQTQPAAVSVSAYRPHLDAAEEESLGKLVIAAACRISDRLGGLGNMVSW